MSTALSAGMALAVCVDFVCVRERQLLQLPKLTTPTRYLRAACVVASAAILFVLYYWASMDIRCLDTDEVQPSWPGRQWRYAYHAVLIALLILSTAVDFDCYVIPDSITFIGTILGLCGACLIGEVQICHLWVDWSMAIPQLRGPLIPAWYDSYRFWHALCWSLAGSLTGAGLTWVARRISTLVLRQEAMGLGDVTLMAMIGSFIGWQAVTLVFLIAPLTGLTIGILIRMLTGKTYLPYGPWLSMATVIVLFAWARLWSWTRLTFSDWLSLVALGTVACVGFVLLLWLVQLYKSIPTRNRAGLR